ncbi:MAG: hypothetical protein LUD69_05305 [Oscillospiraceae bacterium]|nr:hypothetical protein [Oscillospiraceae bacterium]
MANSSLAQMQGAMADRPCPSQKVQEYCMYFKLLQRAFGGKVPPAAAGAFNQCFHSSFYEEYGWYPA